MNDQTKPKPRVLFIMHLPPPVHGAAVAGNYIKTSNIINSQIDAEYINLATNLVLKETGKASIKKVFTFFSIVKLVLKTLNKKKFDVSHMSLTASGLGFYKDLLIILILKGYGVKIIYHFHNKGVAKQSNKRVSRLLYQLAFKNTKSILLSSHLYSDISLYVKERDVFYCPYGIPKISGIVPKTLAKNSKKCKLLYLSNMMIEKGVYVLLDSLKILKDEGLSFTCDFVGGWTDITEEEFNQYVLRNGLQLFVSAHGPKYGCEKDVFFNEADVFIFPTFYHYETFGLVNLEAMQYSLPVVSTLEGGIPDVISNGVTGFLVPQRNSQKLAEKIELLISQPALRLEMGNAGKLKYEALFTLNKFEKKFLEIILHAY